MFFYFLNFWIVPKKIIHLNFRGSPIKSILVTCGLLSLPVHIEQDGSLRAGNRSLESGDKDVLATSFGRGELDDAEGKHQVLNTQEKSASAIRHEQAAIHLLETWLSSLPVREWRKIEDIPPKDLDLYLEQFFRTVRKSTGEEYDPKYLMTVRSGLSRYLKDHGYPYSIVRSFEFFNSQESFRVITKRLHTRLSKVDRI